MAPLRNGAILFSDCHRAPAFARHARSPLPVHSVDFTPCGHGLRASQLLALFEEATQAFVGTSTQVFALRDCAPDRQRMTFGHSAPPTTARDPSSRALSRIPARFRVRCDRRSG